MYFSLPLEGGRKGGGLLLEYETSPSPNLSLLRERNEEEDNLLWRGIVNVNYLLSK
jgi:hypothetical protein